MKGKLWMGNLEGKLGSGPLFWFFFLLFFSLLSGPPEVGILADAFLSSLLHSAPVRTHAVVDNPTVHVLRVERRSDVLLDNEPHQRRRDDSEPDMVVQRPDPRIRGHQGLPRLLCRPLGVLRQRRASPATARRLLRRLGNRGDTGSRQGAVGKLGSCAVAGGGVSIPLSLSRALSVSGIGRRRGR